VWPVRRHLQKRRERSLLDSRQFRHAAGSGQAGE